MLVRRPRASSLHIPIPSATQWRAQRPPTPRRSTYPQPSTMSNATLGNIVVDVPYVPPISYWEPDTPEPLTSPLSLQSPCNPFLSPPPPPIDQEPVLITPTFLFPRTPPLPPSLHDERQVTRRPSTPYLMPQKPEKVHWRAIPTIMGAIRRWVLAETMLKKRDATMLVGNTEKGVTSHKKTGEGEKEWKGLVKWRASQVMNGVVVRA